MVASDCGSSPIFISFLWMTANWRPANACAGFPASWSSTTTSPSPPTSALPTCFPPGWTGAVPPSWMPSRASISTRTSCCPGRCASTWTCKAPSERTPCCLLPPSSLLEVSSCRAAVLLLTVEKPAALPERASDRFQTSQQLGRVQILLKVKLPGHFELMNPLQRVGNGNNSSHFQCVLTLVTLKPWIINHLDKVCLSVKTLRLVGTRSCTNLNYRMLQREWERSSAVKKGKCLCSLWNEVRAVLIAPSGRGAPGAEKTLKSPNGCSLYSIFVRYVLVHYRLNVSVFVLKCHVWEDYLCEEFLYFNPSL